MMFIPKVASLSFLIVSAFSGLAGTPFHDFLYSPPGSCDPAIETHIAGDFNGWDDETIYKMDNGQIWQQANYHYHYHYAYHPEVLIYKSGSGCHIKVTGDDDRGVDVVRLK
jgi:hypothetical protein